MMAGKFSEFLSRLFTGTVDRRDVRRLAQEVEVKALQPAGQQTAPVPDRSPRESLRAACAALDTVIRDCENLAVDRRDVRRLAQKVEVKALQAAGQQTAAVPDRSPRESLRAACATLDAVIRQRHEGANLERASRSPKTVADATPSRESPSGAGQLIELRDQLLLAARSEHVTVPELSQHLYARLGDVLRAQGVEVLEDEGPLDPARHEVIQVHDTTDEALDGLIAETLRPGYRFDHRLLRAQQVVTWRAGAPQAVAPGAAGNSDLR